LDRGSTPLVSTKKEGKIFCPLFWYRFEEVEEPLQSFALLRGLSGSEQSAKDFSLEEIIFLKRKSVGTFNASDQDTPLVSTIKIKTTIKL